MSNYNQHDVPVAYPPPPATKTATEGYYSNGPCVMAPPPIGYPTRDGHDQEGQAPKFHATNSRGGGFWKGCVAALCCCGLLDCCCCGCLPFV